MANSHSTIQTKTVLKNTFVFAVFIMLFSCSKFGPEQQLAWDKIEKGALIIDVRTKEEFKLGHLNNAINIEYENIPLLASAIGQDKSRSVVLYCRSGRRASVTLNALNKLGYNNVYNAQALSKMQAALKNKQENEQKNI